MNAWKQPITSKTHSHNSMMRMEGQNEDFPSVVKETTFPGRKTIGLLQQFSERDQCRIPQLQILLRVNRTKEIELKDISYFLL